MHSTALVTFVMAITAAAAPSNAVVAAKRQDTSVNVTPEQIVFAAQAADCSIISCASVLASAGCIVAGLATGQVPAVLGCVAGGAAQLCGCAGCVDLLNDFLTENGLCEE
ncbi:hypothetical protein GTA08_BOTSDO13659 [Botryosphaeria dothidea]|uniref:Fungal calcium binding protein domain-containing protein n=1 Tax=Botryosphaeria dothidea TaxID=55169 RepID=A0A8H4N4I6_9PEZI|nr:hypothetical protein GTA08_BOTSDO13659 [Botryosphaeria dothidea]